MNIFDLLQKCTGFEWDKHNAEKNRQKHGVRPSECEQIFFNRPLVLAEDARHAQKENRFHTLGVADRGRILFVVFTIRGANIGVISARDMNRREREAYESHD